MKILVSWHRLPNVESHLTIRIKNIVEALKTRTHVETVWLVFMPEKLSTIPNFASDIKIIDIHDYKNALEVLEKEKPDIVFGSSSYNLISYSLSIAGKFLGIPVISDFIKGLSSDQLLTSNIGLFFEKSVSTDEHKNQQQFMRRGRFFLYKFLFVIKTQISTKMTFLKKIKFCLILLKHHLSYEELPIDSRFSNNLHWLSNESLVLPLIQAGFDHNAIIVTGDPLFDKEFKRMSDSKIKKNDKKSNALFAPSTNYEHGLCTKSEQDKAIKSVIEIILKNNSLNLTLKIHPSSAVFFNYRDLIKTIDPTIQIHQSGNIMDYIENSDLIIVFPSTLVCIYALVAKKPIIIYNFSNMKEDIFIEKKIAFECKDPSQLPALINLALKNPISEDKINKFLTSFFYKTDGLASERLANEIFELLKNFKK